GPACPGSGARYLPLLRALHSRRGYAAPPQLPAYRTRFTLLLGARSLDWRGLVPHLSVAMWPPTLSPRRNLGNRCNGRLAVPACMRVHYETSDDDPHVVIC